MRTVDPRFAAVFEVGSASARGDADTEQFLLATEVARPTASNYSFKPTTRNDRASSAVTSVARRGLTQLR